MKSLHQLESRIATSQCSSAKTLLRKKRTMSRTSLQRSPGLPRVDSRSWPSQLLSDLLLKLSCTLLLQNGSNHTETFHFCSTSGPMLFVGNLSTQLHSLEQESSFGKKDIPLTRMKQEPPNKFSIFLISMLNAMRNCSLSQL